ncbi:MBL fold metallo-hydrolase [Kribbella sancticallisti]|uniref:MBL fold metallo-hydrolase n=1 Tax=Kribbella sancticallisti TaxID=460087 RepID=A0ABN2ENI1_9ACTN
MTAQPDLLEIAPSLYRLRIPDGEAHLLNSYVWLGPDSVALFDTGWVHSAPLVEAALHALGRSRKDVGQVVLSHFHEDHAGAAAEIAAWGNAEIIAGAAEAPVVRGVDDGPLPRFTAAEKTIHSEPTEPPRAPACRVDTEVVDGDILPIAGEAQVLHLPGHTPGSIALHLPRLDVVLTGDTVAEFNGQVVLGVFNVDRAETRHSALSIAATGARIAGFGHGEPVMADASARIEYAQDPFADPPTTARSQDPRAGRPAGARP